MKFLLSTLLTHHPDAVMGEEKSPADRRREVVDAARSVAAWIQSSVAPALRARIPSRPLAAHTRIRQVLR
jgi:hypothetical protein